MSSILKSLLSWIRSIFFSKELEITIIGLQNSGKTSLVNVLMSGQFSETMVPTVGFNMRKYTKGSVTIKLWGTFLYPRFRSMWERYCRGVSAILFVVDSADKQSIDQSKVELQSLISQPQLSGIPLLVLGNKNDLAESLKVGELIEKLELSKVTGREVSIYSISCKESINVDVTLNWLLKRAT
ncbi:ADP-ribosylation factor-like protein 8A [Phakopsora pachyrhizi]|uniref:ADP-ribosylation factor-like protein 8A n=1 Tax=Phakopsora pachyrhizi TaxID=170000 RepID=A0AAV0AJM7_PHAPC|nr:ADP-ribosylation factor-like protein 8A [Phakopsora pachyrhizi]KAI8448121.1 ADP-ribosylation factor-like protein 8A [Phakopsora pachyrhizi]CAH7668217.1 ADP-ribosylation factor-like protein 8A [Phakopsora pachyrhizi]CAH7670713.1 ADP-ribosylation factor-like protein 8A [Phakopsora pachyrhizi]